MSPSAGRALERVLRLGDVMTPPGVDADRIAKTSRRHRIPVTDLVAAAAEIRDMTRRPRGALAVIVWRIWGDQGAEVLDRAVTILGNE